MNSFHQPFPAHGDAVVLEGDCIEVMRTLEAESVDSVVCDPPYSLEFMGRKWDKHESPLHFQQWCQEWTAEALRVLKPGGYLLAFGGTRTYHRLASGIEDAGFDIRDSIHWLYGSGFPKSMNVSKAIDKAAGAEREMVDRVRPDGINPGRVVTGYEGFELDATKKRSDKAATPEAERWQGWGTALKPAHEPIVVARKPLSEKTVVANVLLHGTGAMNIDASRIGSAPRPLMVRTETVVPANAMSGESTGATASGELTDMGRWPANLILSHSEECVEDCAPGCPVAEIDDQSGSSTSRAGNPRAAASGTGWGMTATGAEYADKGGASRFFYHAKSSKKDRNYGLSAGQKNPHPTVKPIDLMQYLIRLVTPPGGLVLDPFSGSGSCGIAAVREGFDYVGIEMDPEYVTLAQTRIGYAMDEQSQVLAA